MKEKKEKNLPRSKSETSDRARSYQILCIQDFSYDLHIRSNKHV
jgi:hypothetical protein